MDWHDDPDSRTGGLKGWSMPSYGWGILPDGRKYELIGYSEVRNAKSYSEQSQQAFEVRRGGGGDGHDYSIPDYSPPNHDMSKKGNQHRLLTPWHAATPKVHDMALEDSIKPVHLLPNTDDNSKRNNSRTGYKHNIPPSNPHAFNFKSRDYGSMHGNSSDDNKKDSPKPVHLVAYTGGGSKDNNSRNSNNTGFPTGYKHNIPPNKPHAYNFKSHDYGSMYGNSSDDDNKDSPKPVHLVAHTGGSSKDNNSRNSNNTGLPTGYKHNIPPNKPHAFNFKSHDYGSIYGNSSDDDDYEDSPQPVHMAAHTGGSSKHNNPRDSHNTGSATGYKHNIPPNNPHGIKPRDYGTTYGNSSDDDNEDSPKPVHLVAHRGSSSKHNSPRNSHNTGSATVYNHNIPGVGLNPQDYGARYGNSNNDDSEYNRDSDNGSMYSRRGQKHGSNVSNYPKAHENPNEHNTTQVNPSVPITTQYGSRAFAADPPQIKTDTTTDHFHKKSPTHVVEAPAGGKYNRSSQINGKGHQGIIDSNEARRLYGSVEVPIRGYTKEQYNNMIYCREAAETYKGVFLPTRIMPAKNF